MESFVKILNCLNEFRTFLKDVEYPLNFVSFKENFEVFKKILIFWKRFWVLCKDFEFF